MKSALNFAHAQIPSSLVLTNLVTHMPNFLKQVDLFNPFRAAKA